MNRAGVAACAALALCMCTESRGRTEEEIVRATLDEDALDRIRALPTNVEAMGRFPDGTTRAELAVLSVMDGEVTLVLVGAIAATIPLEVEQVRALRSGELVELRPDVAATVTFDDASWVSTQIGKISVASNLLGQFVLEVTTSDAGNVTLYGRLQGTCTTVDEGGAVLRIADVDSNALCRDVVGWL